MSYARMDRCRSIPQRMAVRKAYTAALSGQDTLAYAERLKSQGRTVAEMGDPNLAAVQGGLVVLHAETGTIMGGIGVSGLTAQEDEDIARLGLRALGSVACPHKSCSFPRRGKEDNAPPLPEFERKNRSVFLARLSHSYNANGIAKPLGDWLS